MSKGSRIATARTAFSISLLVVICWTVAVLWPGWFLWFDHQLAWRFTARWAALTALLMVVVPAMILHLAIRSTKDAPERPTEEGSQDPAEMATKILDFRRAGLKGLIIGADGRASTSQFQAVLWFVALLFGLLFLLLLARSPNCPFPEGQKVVGSCPVVKAGATFPSTLGTSFAWEYLLLLGYPLAVAITARKQVLNALDELRKSVNTDTKEKEVQPGTPAASEKDTNVAVSGKITPVSAKSPPATVDAIGFAAGIRDLLCNDRGHGSLMDTQYLAFTLVTILYFLLEVISHPAKGLPEIPSALLVLMGISGAGYLGAKAIDPLGAAGTASSGQLAPVDTPAGPDPKAKPPTQAAQRPPAGGDEDRGS
ncbi:hypothetical protein AB0K00_09475 [Dactylosporangium sp. NPDC049525]|uniref:hypothetical protein n=1 Tax=Dactylosporangium sp. NPDC049525 TaxID=3154730 RepID=UPI003432E107